MEKKKRIWARITSLCLTLLMALGLFGTAAFAAPIQENSGQITVSGVEEGVLVSAYQVLDVNFDYASQEAKSPLYVWSSEVQNWVKTNYASYIKSADNSVTEAFSNATADNVAAFYDAMAAAIRGGTIQLTPVTRTDNVTIGSLPMGGYLILIENGMKVYRPSAVNVVPVYSDSAKEWQMSDPTVQVKASEIGITKTINEDVKNDGHNPSVSDNGAIGDKVNYDLRADIPTYPAAATAKGFAISDTLSKGLTLDKASIKVYGVKGSSETLLNENDAYTYGTTRPGGLGTSSFTLTFVYDKISGYDSIHVDYNAVINKDAVVGPTGNENGAILDYNNNPYNSSSWESVDPTVKVYTYGIKITKVNEEDHPLTGAEFKLSKKSDGSDAMYFVKTAEGKYRLATSGTESGAGQTLAVNSEGKLDLAGLGEGTYYLTETKAADGGYNILSQAMEIVIKDANFDGRPTLGGSENEYEDGYVPVKVVNTKGFQLPETGGMGTVLFSAGGIALMGAAILLAVMLYRRKADRW